MHYTIFKAIGYKTPRMTHNVNQEFGVIVLYQSTSNSSSAVTMCHSADNREAVHVGSREIYVPSVRFSYKPKAPPEYKGNLKKLKIRIIMKTDSWIQLTGIY